MCGIPAPIKNCAQRQREHALLLYYSNLHLRLRPPPRAARTPFLRLRAALHAHPTLYAPPRTQLSLSSEGGGTHLLSTYTINLLYRAAHTRFLRLLLPLLWRQPYYLMSSLRPAAALLFINWRQYVSVTARHHARLASSVRAGGKNGVAG